MKCDCKMSMGIAELTDPEVVTNSSPTQGKFRLFSQLSFGTVLPKFIVEILPSMISFPVTVCFLTSLCLNHSSKKFHKMVGSILSPPPLPRSVFYDPIQIIYCYIARYCVKNWGS